MKQTKFTRRQVLKSTAAAGGGLVVAYYIPGKFGKAFAADAPAAKYPPNAFVKIAPDNTITMTINKLEMGQGVNTSLAQLIAEELECDWTKIRSVSAPVNPVYNSTMFPLQMTGGSTSVSTSWEQHRKIGAGMREMLKAAAAMRWKAPVSEVKAANGFITHPRHGKLSYGELAEEAGKLPFPENPKLKDPKDFKVIGKSVKRVDAPDKVNGKAIYGLDVRVPGMLYAFVARPPMPTAKLEKFDDKAAKKVPGVVDVVQFPGGVAVLAKNSHAARLGREAMGVVWKDGTNGKFNSEQLMKEFKQKALTPGVVAGSKDNVEKAGTAAKTLVMEYEFPYLAHACMEPMNCTINFDGKTCEMWSGHQMPGLDQMAASQVLGIPAEQIKVHTVYAGGSFGRRGAKGCDYALEAAQLAKVVKKPLKVVWSREDDMRGGYYRPMNFHRVEVKLDGKNNLLAVDHHLVGQSVVAGMAAFEGDSAKTGLERTMNEGISDTKYNFTNYRSRISRLISPMPVQWWRSVGHTHTGYVAETMMDEIAEATGEDPMVLRKELLKNSPRHMAVLNLLSKETGWGKKKPPKGRAWGLAVHESFNTVVGQVAEVSMVNGVPKVHKIWAVADCGQVVNPEVAKTQIESGIVYGLSAAFYQQISVVDGKAVQGNFHEFNVLRLNEMPEVKVAFTASKAPPTGLGEPGVPPCAPAVANAVYKLTKKRLRSLPFSRELA